MVKLNSSPLHFAFENSQTMVDINVWQKYALLMSPIPPNSMVGVWHQLSLLLLDFNIEFWGKGGLLPYVSSKHRILPQFMSRIVGLE